MNFSMSKIKHPKEKLYGALTIFVGVAVWIPLVLLILSVLLTDKAEVLFVIFFYILIFKFMSFVSRAFMRAYMFGHFVMIGPKQFPELYKMVVEGAKAVGLKETPRAFVYNSHGVMNAMALRLVGRHRYVWLTSALIDANDPEQVRFVIGHELGHHVAGHLSEFWHVLRLPGLFVPFLGAAYSRSRELTCDRVGLWLSNNLQASRSALQMLACGSAKLNEQLNPDAFEEQEDMLPPISGFLLHIISTYPRLTQRVEALGEWSGFKDMTLERGGVAQTVEVMTRQEPSFA